MNDRGGGGHFLQWCSPVSSLSQVLMQTTSTGVAWGREWDPVMGSESDQNTLYTCTNMSSVREKGLVQSLPD